MAAGCSRDARALCGQEVAAGAEALYLFQGQLQQEAGLEAEPKLQHKVAEARRLAALIGRQSADLEACLQVPRCSPLM